MLMATHNSKLKREERVTTMSYSMYVENEVSVTKNDEDNKVDGRGLSNTTLIQKPIDLHARKIHKWVDDGTISNCHGCKKKFTMFFRRHHCRACGKIFCSYCSNCAAICS